MRDRALDKITAAFVVLAMACVIAVGCYRNTHAADGDPGDSPRSDQLDRQTADWRSAQTNADTASGAGGCTFANLALAKKFTINGRSLATVSARFSVQNATVRVRLISTNETDPLNKRVLGDTAGEFTLTGNGLKDENGRWMAVDLPLPAFGATHVYLVMTSAVSAGDVTFCMGSV